MSFRRLGLGVVTSLLVALGNGCAYHVGPTNGAPAGSRSIAVMPFENLTLEPRVTESLANALRGQLQQEGSFQIARASDADVIVRGVVREISREEQSFQPSDVRVLRDYRLEISAHVTATERGTGKKVLDRDVRGHTTLRVVEDLASAERQAMPLLTGNLARNITSMLVDGTW